MVMAENICKELKHFKVKSIPQIPEADAIYYVLKEGDEKLSKICVTDTLGLPFCIEVNNVPTVIETTATNTAELTIWINQKNPNLKISELHIPYFKTTNEELYILNNKGKGSYGLNGIPVEETDLIKLKQDLTPLLTIEDINNVPVTFTTTATDVATLVTWLNGQNPPIEITANQIPEWELIDGTRYRFENKGKGIYGVGKTPVVETDFIIVFKEPVLNVVSVTDITEQGNYQITNFEITNVKNIITREYHTLLQENKNGGINTVGINTIDFVNISVHKKEILTFFKSEFFTFVGQFSTIQVGIDFLINNAVNYAEGELLQTQFLTGFPSSADMFFIKRGASYKVIGSFLDNEQTGIAAQDILDVISLFGIDSEYKYVGKDIPNLIPIITGDASGIHSITQNPFIFLTTTDDSDALISALPQGSWKKFQSLTEALFNQTIYYNEIALHKITKPFIFKNKTSVLNPDNTLRTPDKVRLSINLNDNPSATDDVQHVVNVPYIKPLFLQAVFNQSDPSSIIFKGKITFEKPDIGVVTEDLKIFETFDGQRFIGNFDKSQVGKVTIEAELGGETVSLVEVIGSDVVISDSETIHTSKLVQWFNFGHGNFQDNFIKTIETLGRRLKGSEISSYIKENNAHLSFEAIGGEEINLEEIRIDSDILHISAHGANDPIRIDRTKSEYDFLQNVIMVGAGLETDLDANWTTSFGFGIEFIEPTSVSTNPTIPLGSSETDVHQQSPATAIVAGKLKAIKDACQWATWNTIRTYARRNASRATQYDIYRGFGVINKQATIDALNADKSIIIGEEAAHYNRFNKVPENITFDLLDDNAKISKKLVNGNFLDATNDFIKQSGVFTSQDNVVIDLPNPNFGESALEITAPHGGIKLLPGMLNVDTPSIEVESDANGVIIKTTIRGEEIRVEKNGQLVSSTSNFNLENNLVTDAKVLKPTLNGKFVRKSIRKLIDNEEINSNLKGLFLPEISASGKLLNLLDTSGTTDFVYTRAGVKYRHRESLLIEEIGANVPVVDYLNGYPELIVEPQRTNLILNSEPIANEGGASAQVTYEQQSSPFGITNFVRVPWVSGSTILRWAGTVTDNNYYEISNFLRVLPGRIPHFTNQLSASDDFYEYGLRGNTAVNKIGKIRVTKFSEEFYKVSIIAFPDGSVVNSDNGLVVRSGQPTKSDIVASGISLTLSSQTEFPGSYIKTTGATKTVDADVYTISNLLSNGLISSTEGTIIERGTFREKRTVWTGGNKIIFIDNAQISSVAELPSDAAFTLDTGNYRVSETLISNKALLP